MTRNARRLAAAIVCATALAPLSAVRAATIHVPADQPTIQIAVLLSLNGDEVIVAPGVYHENVNMAGRRITLRSSGGPAVTTIDGGGAGPVLRFENCEADTVVQGFMITGGAAPEGGGLHMTNSGPVIRECVIEGNAASCAGGGAWSDQGATMFEQCVIRDNTAGGCAGGGASGAGVFASGGSISFTDCQITANRSTAPSLARGVGLCTTGAIVQMSSTSVSGNDASASAEADGVGMHHEGSFLVISGGAIESNRPATVSAAGIGASHVACVVSMSEVLVRDNRPAGAMLAGDCIGGGVRETDTSSTYSDCSFEDNAAGGAATGDGGAVAVEGGSATFLDCRFTGNEAASSDPRGGGVYATGVAVQIGGTMFCGNEPTDIDGPLADLGGNSFGDCCPGDITGPAGAPDGAVDALDFLFMVGQWGACAGCASDITGPGGEGDGVVDALDYLALIASWGGC